MLQSSFLKQIVLLNFLSVLLGNHLNHVFAKNSTNYVTYTVSPGYESFVDDPERENRIKDKQSRIESELQDQLKHSKLISDSLKVLQRNGAIVSDYSNDGLKFQESTIALMEAPIFLIEPSMLLLMDEIEGDLFSKHLMEKSGLASTFEKPEDEDIKKLMNPLTITNIEEAKLAKSLFKQELTRLMNEKKILLDRMEELEGKFLINKTKGAMKKFNECSKEIHEIDANIRDLIDKIDKVNRVKRAIIKKNGYTPELEQEELDVEEIEKQLEKQAASNKNGGETKDKEKIKSQKHHRSKKNDSNSESEISDEKEDENNEEDVENDDEDVENDDEDEVDSEE